MASTPESDPNQPLEAIWLGRFGFEEALKLQQARREAVVEGRAGPCLYLVEHPPTVTLGRRATREHVLWSGEQIDQAGLSVCETPRGGEATLHAPGQLVVYPVIHVGRQIRAHIVGLAEVAIALLEQLGVRGAAFRMDHPGVWIGPQKIASIGVHIRRGVSIQGLALNLDVAPGFFTALVSCGLPDVEIVSARQVGARPIDVAEAARRYAELYAEHLGTELSWLDAPSVSL